MTTLKHLALAAVFTLMIREDSKAAFSLDFESGGVWNVSNNVRIPSNTGTRFSLTDDLKSEATVYFRAGGTWQFNDRHSLSFLFAPLRTESYGELSGDTLFAGSRFRGGVPTGADYRFDSYRLTYRYNVVQTEKVTLGLGLTANVRSAKVELNQDSINAYDDNVGIVPLLNFRFEWRFAPRWSFLTEGDALYSSRGRIEDVLAAIQWQANDNLSLRLGYRLLEGGADSDSVYNFARFNQLAAGLTWKF